MSEHYDDAKRLDTESSLLNEWGFTEREILATRANTYATLALAYEQRTANLIAMFGEGTYHSLNNEQRKDLLGQIEERLGLA